MVSTLVQNARYVDLIPALGRIFPIFIIPMTLLYMLLCGDSATGPNPSHEAATLSFPPENICTYI